MKQCVAVGLALAFGTTTTAARAATDYAQAGPHATTTTTFASGTAGSLGGSIVVPNDAGVYPLIIASHGWSAASDRQVGWGEHFRRAGGSWWSRRRFRTR